MAGLGPAWRGYTTASGKLEVEVYPQQGYSLTRHCGARLDRAGLRVVWLGAARLHHAACESGLRSVSPQEDATALRRGTALPGTTWRGKTELGEATPRSLRKWAAKCVPARGCSWVRPGVAKQCEAGLVEATPRPPGNWRSKCVLGRGCSRGWPWLDSAWLGMAQRGLARLHHGLRETGGRSVSFQKIRPKSKAFWAHGKHKGAAGIARLLDRERPAKPASRMYGSVIEAVRAESKRTGHR